MCADLTDRADIFQGLNTDERTRLMALGRAHRFAKDEYLFYLGDSADRLFVVASGKVTLCFPMQIGDEVKDVSMEDAGAGDTLGWSALVKPYRFTRSARTAEPTEVIAFTRRELLEFFDAEPFIGYVFMTRISELVGVRLLRVRALWVRAMQRAIVDSHSTGPSR